MNTQVEQLQVFRGIVRNAYRSPDSLFTFRIEELDDSGDIIGYKVVECHAIDTDLASNGDEVEVIGRVKQDGAILPQKLTNFVTGQTVEASKWLYDLGFKARNNPERTAKLFGGVFLALFFISSCMIILIPLFTGISRINLKNPDSQQQNNDRQLINLENPDSQQQNNDRQLINLENPDSQQQNNGRPSSLLRIETVTLNNCQIENTFPFPKELRSNPDPFSGYTSGRLEAHSTYPAIERADRVVNHSGDIFDTWFYVKNNSQEGWISGNTPNILAVGNCDR